MEVYHFAAFRSRDNTVRFYERLRSQQVRCSVINTPKEASVGCGISVKYSPQSQKEASQALARGNYKTFIGFFEVTEQYGRRYINPIKEV